MNDERCDRDRVTAIIDAPCDCDKPAEVTGVGHRDWCRGYTDEVWLARRLLEALDTIDKARELHEGTPSVYSDGSDRGRVCPECSDFENGMTVPWPCPTWRALNGGNESGDDR